MVNNYFDPFDIPRWTNFLFKEEDGSSSCVAIKWTLGAYVMNNDVDGLTEWWAHTG